VPTPTNQSPDQGHDVGRRLLKQSETGSRIFSGKLAILIPTVAISMSLFQLYTGLFGELPGSKQLSIHLAFAVFLCFVCFPASKKSPRHRISLSDWVLAIVGTLSALYLFVNYDHVVTHVGDAKLYDLIIGGVLIVLLLEATRRSISPILPIITLIFLLYAYFGPYLPGENWPIAAFESSASSITFSCPGKGSGGSPCECRPRLCFCSFFLGLFWTRWGPVNT
jgi:TRAP-type uncharacterized transport system fused permease subunit